MDVNKQWFKNDTVIYRTHFVPNMVLLVCWALSRFSVCCDSTLSLTEEREREREKERERERERSRCLMENSTMHVDET